MTHKYFTTLLVSMICLGYALTVGAATYHVYPKGTAVTGKNAITGFSDWKIQPKPGDVIFLYDEIILTSFLISDTKTGQELPLISNVPPTCSTLISL